MIDTPQEPSPLEPEMANSQPQEDSPQAAGVLDELRKDLTTQELSEKAVESKPRPGLLRQVTKPLTGAIRRLRGTHPLSEERDEKKGKAGQEELQDSLFERVLPPVESLPPGDDLKALPAWAGGEDAPFEAATSSLDMPFDSSLDDTAEELTESSLEMPADSWPFDDSLTSQGGQDLPGLEEGEPLPPGLEADDSDLSPENDAFLEKPAKDKPRGWRKVVTDLLGRTKPLATPESSPEYEVDDAVLTGRLGLAENGGPDIEAPVQAGASQDEDESILGQLSQDQDPLIQDQAQEKPFWSEDRADLIVEDTGEPGPESTLHSAEAEMTGEPMWPENAEDWMQNLQSERESLLEDVEKPAQPDVNNIFSHNPFEYRSGLLEEEAAEGEGLEDESVSVYWDQPLFPEEQDTIPAETLVEPVAADASMPDELSLDNMRDVILQEYETPESKTVEVSEPAEERRWMGFTRTQIIILAGMSVVVLVTLMVAAGVILQYSRAAARPPVPTLAATLPAQLPAGPHPTGIELTGGWPIPLTPSTVVEGKWQPQGPEWLTGSEIRRVVALPWNRQLEAVIMTLIPGDVIHLSFDNGQTIAYHVDKVERITASSTSRLEDLSPSLLVVLAQEASTDRWVVTCSPVEVQPSP